MKNNKGFSAIVIMLIIVGILVVIGVVFYLTTDIRDEGSKILPIEDPSKTYTDVPEFLDIDKLITSPAKYQDHFIATGSEVLYHVKGIDGFAVGYYNLYTVSNEVKDYIWLDKGVIPEFSFQESSLNESWAQRTLELCKKGQTAEGLKSQIGSFLSADKIVESIEEFSKYYQISENSITAYICTNGYDIMGKFADSNSVGGPNNQFHFIIKPNKNKFDREKFVSELNIEQPIKMKFFELKAE